MAGLVSMLGGRTVVGVVGRGGAGDDRPTQRLRQGIDTPPEEREMPRLALACLARSGLRPAPDRPPLVEGRLAWVA